jgi:hypothetical protein
MKPPESGRELAAYLADPGRGLVLVSGHDEHPVTFVALVEPLPGGLRARRIAGGTYWIDMPRKWAPGPEERLSAQERHHVQECLTFDARGFVACGVRVTYLDPADPFRPADPGQVTPAGPSGVAGSGRVGTK